MPLNIKGLPISEVIGEGAVVINGIPVDFVRINGQLVWEKKVPAGSQTFSSSGTFIVPQGIHSVNLCMVGGGGGGASAYSEGGRQAGGGYRGALVQQAVAVTPGQSISVVIGAGGASIYSQTQSNGNPGGASSFGAVVAAGGAGGIQSSGYVGVGANYVSLCNGITYKDGTRAVNNYVEGRGGQAGQFGNAGNGAINAHAGNGGIGAGGGGCAWNITGVRSGAGGAGYCVVSWS